MIQPFTELAQRYRGREDSEHEQAFVRLAIIVVFLAYLLGATAFDRATGDRAALVLYVLLAETAVAIGLLVWIAWRPESTCRSRTLRRRSPSWSAPQAWASPRATARRGLRPWRTHRISSP